MSFIDCVNTKVENGELDKKRAEVAKERFERMKEVHPDNPDADPSIQKEVLDELTDSIEEGIAKDEYRVLNDAYKIDQVLKDLEKIDRYSEDVDDLSEAAIALVSKDFGKMADIDSAEQIQEALESQYNGYIASFWKEFNDANGKQGKRIVEENVLRVIKDGEDISKFDNEMADGFEKLFKTIHEDANLEGIALNRRENYFPNPNHAREPIINAGFDGYTGKKAWVEYLRRGNNGEGLLDEEKMIDKNTGMKMKPEQLYGPKNDDTDFGLMGEIYENITKRSDGDREIGAYRQKAFRKKHNDPRILHFKNADAWMNYNQRFGDGHIGNAIERYIKGMSRDIAAAKRFGSRPSRVKRIVSDFIMQKAESDEMVQKSDLSLDDLQDKAETGINSFEENWELFFESNMASPNMWSKGLAGMKQLTTSATIGSATISAVGGDVGNTAFTAWFNSMPVVRTSMAGVKNFSEGISQKALRGLGLWEGKTADEAIQQQALEAGLTARAALDESVGYARYLQKQEGFKTTKALANKTMKWSGLNMFTRTGRSSFQVEYGKYFARLANSTKWDELKEVTDSFFGRKGGFVDMLNRYNIGEKEWRVLRQTDFKVEKAGGFAGETGKAFEWFRPIDIESEKMIEKTGLPKRELREISNKFRRMFITEEGHAVPTVNNRSRAILGKYSDSNTFIGLLGRAAGQYKSFPLTQYTNNFSRMMLANDNGIGWGKFSTKAAMAYLGFMVPMGGIALQMREIAQGNDPRDITEESFWLDSLMASGGLSVFGDVLFRGRDSDFSFMNNQPLQLAGGPTFSFADDVLDITIGNSYEAYSSEEEMNLGKDTVDFFRSWTPMGNMWYSRLATDRLLFDTLEELADPKAKRRFRKQYREQILEDNQGSFVPPGTGSDLLFEGETEQLDTPDFSNMFGGPE